MNSKSKHPFIYPFSLHGSWWQQAKQGSSDLLLHSHSWLWLLHWLWSPSQWVLPKNAPPSQPTPSTMRCTGCRHRNKKLKRDEYCNKLQTGYYFSVGSAIGREVIVVSDLCVCLCPCPCVSLHISMAEGAHFPVCVSEIQKTNSVGRVCEQVLF